MGMSWLYSFAKVVWLLLLFFLASLHGSAPDGFRSNSHRNVSELLDNLLRGYDNSVRPDFGGPPTIVEIDIHVRSMGPVSEMDMTYSMDCYFRQTWIDARLSYSAASKGSVSLALSISMLSRIWKPDTIFWNGKQSYLHTITTPNKFVRLYEDGRVLYSSRLTVKASCPMNLEDFPMDTQRCPLKLGSFGYTSRDVLYRWNANRTVDIATDMKMSQFDLISVPAGNSTDLMKSGEYSSLVVSFHLHRHMGNYLITVYGPCTLLVVLSWLGFWLNREATADRISLGVMTVLTLCFLGLDTRSDLPKVPYPTALDFFVFLSFVFIFATIIQFAVVHYFTKFGSGEKYFCEETTSEEESDFDESHIVSMGGMGAEMTGRSNQMSVIEVPLPKLNNGGLEMESSILPLDPSSFPHRNRRPSNWSFCRRKRKRNRKSEFEIINSVSQIDRLSRVLFPLTFLAINIFYWYSYLKNSTPTL